LGASLANGPFRIQNIRGSGGDNFIDITILTNGGHINIDSKGSVKIFQNGTEVWDFDGSGFLVPFADNLRDIGTSSIRVRAAYSIAYNFDATAGLKKLANKVVGASDGTTVNSGWLTDAGIKRASAQFNKTTDTALANITGLSVNVEAGRTYSFEALLFVDADATGGSKYAIAGTATATAIIYEVALIDNATNAFTITSRQTALGGAAGQAGTTAGLCRISGTITVNAAGTLTVQFAQNASNGTSSVLVGSSFIVRDNP
jgi:hypothetical protein